MEPTSEHKISRSFYQKCLTLVCGLLFFAACGTVFAQSALQLSRSDLSPSDRTIYITDTWRYQAGDGEWHAPDLPDSTWQPVSTYLGPEELPFIDWNGIGWFRLHFRVDSTLINYPLALLIAQHNGASEIYLDGKLLYKLGRVSSLKETYKPYRDEQPRAIIITDTTTHVLAVRYVNFDAETFIKYGFTAGFRFLLGDLEYHTTVVPQKSARLLRIRLFYAGILLAFTVIHFLLFAFYPDEKRNLYFALFTGFLTILSVSLLMAGFSSSPSLSISYYRISLMAWVLTVVYALQFSYSLYYKKTPRAFWIFLLIGFLLATGSWFRAQDLNGFRELFVLLTLLEILRVLSISFIKKRKGIWIIGTGLILFVGGLVHSALANLNMLPGDPILGNLYGSAGLILGMSIYLSRNFAQTNSRLKLKLQEVKHLSEVTLQQERLNKQREMERKLLEAEHRRKSQELEEARALQLSLLPTKLPKHDYWDVAVYIETAQEVGGDYYDFAFDDNGTMSVALGDATGHGMKAGIIVATAKSFFQTLTSNHDIVDMLHRMSSGIRNMNLRMMYMSMLFLRCNKHTVEYTSAGMPPVLCYHSKTQSVTRHLLKGMPLGTNIKFPYQRTSFTLSPGDSLMLMSDGLMELFNSQRDLLGIERIEEALQKYGHLPASEILGHIIEIAKKWAENTVQEDDITVMVLQAKDG